jgi:HSP20 family protein
MEKETNPKDVFAEIREGLSGLGQKVNRIFDDFMSGDLVKSDVNIRVDIYETKEHFIIEAELPGVLKEQVKIQVSDSVLTIKGDKKRASEIKEDAYHRHERRFGTFIRSFQLPHDVQMEEIKASFLNGVISIRFPKETPAEEKGEGVQVDIE